MSVFMSAMTTNDRKTTNGALAHSTTNSNCLDFFYKAGGLRGDNATALLYFKKAFAENSELALRILLHLRDVRGGTGERGLFRGIFTELCNTETDIASSVLKMIPELGRWDDMIIAFGTPLQSEAETLWLNALVKDENALAAKWCPREKSKNPHVFRAMVKRLGISNSQFRKVLSMLSDTVEQKMCRGEWNAIDFSKLPSVASARYQKSFGRNATEKYGEYIENLSTGEATINAGAVYPYDVIKSIRNGNKQVASAQWDALPDYMDGTDERIMPVVDVSGSMDCSVGGSATNSLTCIDVAVSLGMYIAERNTGVFKNQFISFSGDPHFHAVSGVSLSDRYNSVIKSGEDYNTDINKVFTVMLDRAKRANLTQEDLPTKMLILSDMQFDVANRRGYMYGTKDDKSTLEDIKEHYIEAGYEMPQLVFWNLRSVGDSVPCKMGENGTALVSGCSPSILKSLLKGTLEPHTVMLDAVNIDRYKLDIF